MGKKASPSARLDERLVAEGFAPTPERARALVMTGTVLVNDVPATSAGAKVPLTAELRIKGGKGEAHDYVSRGALKLVQALDAFAIDPAGLVCVDVGASTGGFTDVLLRRGAARVYAIDVGYGQLAWSLQTDARVVVLDRTNVRTMAPGTVPEACGLAVIDVSFVSLTALLADVAALLVPGAPIVALIKPQFEAPREYVEDGGVVRAHAGHVAAIDRVVTWAQAHGFFVGARCESPIRGPAGNVEFLQMLSAPGG